MESEIGHHFISLEYHVTAHFFKSEHVNMYMANCKRGIQHHSNFEGANIYMVNKNGAKLYMVNCKVQKYTWWVVKGALNTMGVKNKDGRVPHSGLLCIFLHPQNYHDTGEPLLQFTMYIFAPVPFINKRENLLVSSYTFNWFFILVPVVWIT